MIEEISIVGRLRENCVRAKRVIRIGSLTFPFCHENSSFHEWSNEIDSGLKKLSLIFRNETFNEILWFDVICMSRVAKITTNSTILVNISLYGI